MCQLNGGSATMTLKLEVNTALVEYYAGTLLNQVGLGAESFTTLSIVEAAERALEGRLRDLATDSDWLLHRFAQDERFLRELGV